MGYPSSIKSFTFKRNNIDKVIADDVNLAYTEITEIERQLGGITTTSGGSAGVGVVKSDWGVGTFGTGITNWYSNDGLAARLKNIEAGLYQVLVSGSILGTTIPSSKTLLTTTSTTSALTTVGTLENLVIGASAGSTPPLKLTSGTNLGTAQGGAFEYDGSKLYFTPNNTTPVRKTVAYVGDIGYAQLYQTTNNATGTYTWNYTVSDYTYRKLVITYEISSWSSGGAVYLKLNNSGSAGVYSATRMVYNTSGNIGTTDNGTGFEISTGFVLGNTGGVYSSYTIELPNYGSSTNWKVMTSISDSAYVAGRAELQAQISLIQFITTGTMTGTFTVYGVK